MRGEALAAAPAPAAPAPAEMAKPASSPAPAIVSPSQRFPLRPPARETQSHTEAAPKGITIPPSSAPNALAGTPAPAEASPSTLPPPAPEQERPTLRFQPLRPPLGAAGSHPAPAAPGPGTPMPSQPAAAAPSPAPSAPSVPAAGPGFPARSVGVPARPLPAATTSRPAPPLLASTPGPRQPAPRLRRRDHHSMYQLMSWLRAPVRKPALYQALRFLRGRCLRGRL
jgi:hypothetical protein